MVPPVSLAPAAYRLSPAGRPFSPRAETPLAPRRLALPAAARQVAAGDFHSLAALTSGAVLGAGDNADGQLGVPGFKEICGRFSGGGRTKGIGVPVYRFGADWESASQFGDSLYFGACPPGEKKSKPWDGKCRNTRKSQKTKALV